MVVGNPLGPDLHPAIDHSRGRIAGQFEFHPKDEVRITRRGAEKIVMRDFVFQRTPGDAAVFDPPHRGISLPSGQRFAIKNRLRMARRGRRFRVCVHKDKQAQGGKKNGEFHWGEVPTRSG